MIYLVFKSTWPWKNFVAGFVCLLASLVFILLQKFPWSRPHWKVFKTDLSIRRYKGYLSGTVTLKIHFNQLNFLKIVDFYPSLLLCSKNASVLLKMHFFNFLVAYTWRSQQYVSIYNIKIWVHFFVRDLCIQKPFMVEKYGLYRYQDITST